MGESAALAPYHQYCVVFVSQRVCRKAFDQCIGSARSPPAVGWYHSCARTSIKLDPGRMNMLVASWPLFVPTNTSMLCTLQTSKRPNVF